MCKANVLYCISNENYMIILPMGQCKREEGRGVVKEKSWSNPEIIVLLKSYL